MAGEFLAGEAGGHGSGTAAAQAARSRGQSQAAGDSGEGEGDRLAWYGDSADGTGDLRDAIGKAGHQAVIKPKPLQSPVEGGFTVDDFTVDEEQGTVTCRPGTPSGSAGTGSPPSAPYRGLPAARAVHHLQDRPQARPAPARCPAPAARADWAAHTGLREDYMKHRPNVERAVAQVATWHVTPAPAPLPRGDQEPRPAQAPHRRIEPA